MIFAVWNNCGTTLEDSDSDCTFVGRYCDNGPETGNTRSYALTRGWNMILLVLLLETPLC